MSRLSTSITAAKGLGKNLKKLCYFFGVTVNLHLLKTPQGSLKIVHVVLGAACLGLTHYFSKGRTENGIRLPNSIPLFFLITASLLYTSCLLLLSFVLENGNRLAKNYFEILYHLFGSLLQLSVAIGLFSVVATRLRLPKSIIIPSNNVPDVNITVNYNDYTGSIAATGVLALVNSLAYFANFFIAQKARSQQSTNNQQKLID